MKCALTKEDIAVGVVERYRAEGYRRLLEERASGMAALDLFDHFFGFAGEWISSNREVAAVGTTASIKGIGHPPERPGTTSVFLEVIAQGQLEGAIRQDLEPSVMARLLGSILLQAALFGPDASDGEVAEWPRRLFRAAVDGLRANNL